MEQNQYLEKLLDQKFENFERIMKLVVDENSKEHCEIIKRLDYTNGKVRRLEVWKGWITGGITLLGFLAGFLGIAFFKALANFL